MSDKHGFVRIILLMLIWVPCETSFGQITQSDLRAYTEHAIKHGYVKMESPVFDWDDRGVKYDLGGARCGYSSPEQREPIMAIPLYAQYVATGIRLSRTERQQRRFWSPVLERVETEIEKMLDIIRESEDVNSTREQLLVCERRIDSVYVDSLDELARESGGRARPKEPACHPCVAFAVEVRIEPQTGQLARIGAGEWSFYSFFKDKARLPKPQWESLPTGDEVRLYGKNWISASWPDGQGWVKLVDIGTAKSITITPAGVHLDKDK